MHIELEGIEYWKKIVYKAPDRLEPKPFHQHLKPKQLNFCYACHHENKTTTGATLIRDIWKVSPEEHKRFYGHFVVIFEVL